MASSFTGFRVQWVDGVDPKSVPESAIPSVCHVLSHPTIFIHTTNWEIRRGLDIQLGRSAVGALI